MTEYQTKDSGVHQEYESGMRRDSQDGKPRFDLIRTKLQPYEEQMIYRYAMLLARGAEKYSARNWEDGCGEEELERAKASLLRHTEQLVAGETDEDHAAAVWFNAQAIEYFRWRLDSPQNDGLTGAERLAKVARASEINNLALRKAAEIRRRERLLGHAKELDAELTAEAQELARCGLTITGDGDARLRLSHTHAPSVEMPEAKVDPIVDVNDDGSPVRESDLTRNRNAGAVGLFQFMDGPWPKPSFEVNSPGVASHFTELVDRALEKIEEQHEKAARLLTRPPAPSQVNDDGTVTFRKGDYDPGYPDENTTQERDDKPVRFEGSSWVVAEPDNN